MAVEKRTGDTKQSNWWSQFAYSFKVYKAFLTLVGVYLVIFVFLFFLQKWGGITFTREINGDILKLTTSLPLVALWIVIMIGAVAGFARSSTMTKYLPFNKVLESRTIEKSYVSGKVRSDATVKKDTSFITMAKKLNSARLSILAVVRDDNTVEGVITYKDVLQKILTEYEHCRQGELLQDRLSKLVVKDIIDLEIRQPVTVNEKNDLMEVLGEMSSHRFHKLIVVKEDKGKTVYAGTIDMRDLVEELVESQKKETDSGE
ncbi:MAG TPA: CBS domain-containing protein [Dehalococcoidales bacterium]|nr:CBS domain-containing protein [Dehalococcoidales bacterium]